MEMKEKWLMPGAVVPVDAETTEALVAEIKRLICVVGGMALDMRPTQQQEPVAYDKTELNCFAQDLYDKKMREGKHGHYESMFHVIHQCIKKVAPPANKPLTDEEIADLWHETVKYAPSEVRIKDFARAIEAAHGIKENT